MSILSVMLSFHIADTVVNVRGCLLSLDRRYLLIKDGLMVLWVWMGCSCGWAFNLSLMCCMFVFYSC